MSSPLEVFFEADASIAPDTTVTFTITVTALNQGPCPRADSITVQATVE